MYPLQIILTPVNDKLELETKIVLALKWEGWPPEMSRSDLAEMLTLSARKGLMKVLDELSHEKTMRALEAAIEKARSAPVTITDPSLE